jgi:deazaflavin-dependent oxidoreductase (nitroreductase family)
MRTWIGLTVAGLLVAATVFIATMFFNERGRQRLLPVLRPLLKGVINPAMLRAIAKESSPYGVVHHRGRRSGAAYATPVDARRTAAGVVITLPYGPDTDWCRNVLAAGSCTLTLGGEDLALTAPQVVPASVAAPQVPTDVARRWQRQGLAHFLALRIGDRARPEQMAEGPMLVPVAGR